ncbi:hypothetical protein EON65_35610 [archaeon]|nr:MAG: hypothetical protein EON65_35610 [archaeon]
MYDYGMVKTHILTSYLPLISPTSLYQMNSLAKSLHVLRGALSRWLLPFDHNTRIDAQCSTPHSVLESMPEDFKGKLSERQVGLMVVMCVSVPSGCMGAVLKRMCMCVCSYVLGMCLNLYEDLNVSFCIPRWVQFISFIY